MRNKHRIQQLDLNLLKVFRSLYEEQNMSRTAEALHLTPSAISHAVRRLRDTLDDPLFQRSQNRMVPTPACRRLAPQIIENLTNLQNVLQQWDTFDPMTSEHTFRLGVHDALEASVLPDLCKTLARKAPNIGIASVKFDRTQLGRELAAGHIDMALDVAMTTKRPVRSQELWSNGFCVMMRSDHPLKGKLDRDGYMAAQHIIVSNRPVGLTMEDTALRKDGLQRQTSIRCQNYWAAAKLLENSDQLLTITKTMAADLSSDKLHIEPLPINIKPYSMRLYRHEHSEADVALSWLRELIINLPSRQKSIG